MESDSAKIFWPWGKQILDKGSGPQTEIFQAKREVFVQLQHLDKHLIKGIRKKGTAIFGVFSPRYS